MTGQCAYISAKGTARARNGSALATTIRFVALLGAAAKTARNLNKLMLSSGGQNRQPEADEAAQIDDCARAERGGIVPHGHDGKNALVRETRLARNPSWRGASHFAYGRAWGSRTG